MKHIDLTQTLGEESPSWDGSPCFQHRKTLFEVSRHKIVIDSLQSDKFGVGTHLDAPAHFVPDGKTIEELAISDLILPLNVIHVPHEGKGSLVPSSALKQFEKEHGRIRPGEACFFNTGWSKFWQSSAEYRCADEKGNMHFPALSEDLAMELCERKVKMIGIDTLSPDTGHEGKFPVHELTLNAGMSIVENLTNLATVPAKGSQVWVLPLKIKNLVESPVRVVAAI